MRIAEVAHERAIDVTGPSWSQDTLRQLSSRLDEHLR